MVPAREKPAIKRRKYIKLCAPGLIPFFSGDDHLTPADQWISFHHSFFIR